MQSQREWQESTHKHPHDRYLVATQVFYGDFWQHFCPLRFCRVYHRWSPLHRPMMTDIDTSSSQRGHSSRSRHKRIGCQGRFLKRVHSLCKKQSVLRRWLIGRGIFENKKSQCHDVSRKSSTILITTSKFSCDSHTTGDTCPSSNDRYIYEVQLPNLCYQQNSTASSGCFFV